MTAITDQQKEKPVVLAFPDLLKERREKEEFARIRADVQKYIDETILNFLLNNKHILASLRNDMYEANIPKASASINFLKTPKFTVSLLIKQEVENESN